MQDGKPALETLVRVSWLTPVLRQASVSSPSCGGRCHTGLPDHGHPVCLCPGRAARTARHRRRSSWHGLARAPFSSLDVSRASGFRDGQQGGGKAAQSAMLPAERSQLGAAARRGVKCRDGTGLCRISLSFLRYPFPAKSNPGKCDGTSLAILVLFLPLHRAVQGSAPMAWACCSEPAARRGQARGRTPGWLQGCDTGGCGVEEYEWVNSK